MSPTADVTVTIGAKTGPWPRTVMGCGTCAHWRRIDGVAPDAYEVVSHVERDRPWEERAGRTGDADVVEYVAANATRWGRCQRVTHGWGQSEVAYVMDASDYHATLNTRDDFGCVEHTTEQPSEVTG